MDAGCGNARLADSTAPARSPAAWRKSACTEQRAVEPLGQLRFHDREYGVDLGQGLVGCDPRDHSTCARRRATSSATSGSCKRRPDSSARLVSSRASPRSASDSSAATPVLRSPRRATGRRRAARSSAAHVAMSDRSSSDWFSWSRTDWRTAMRAIHRVRSSRTSGRPSSSVTRRITPSKFPARAQILSAMTAIVSRSRPARSAAPGTRSHSDMRRRSNGDCSAGARRPLPSPPRRASRRTPRRGRRSPSSGGQPRLRLPARPRA